MINSKYYMHDSDKAALQALKAIPGFEALAKAYMKAWNERQFRILNMSGKIRLGENQMPEYYSMLQPICDKLGIDVPELYLEMNVTPNAYTYGDTKPFIVITSGLLETLPDSLIPTVLAHECGHIACHHTLFTTMGTLLLNGMILGGGIAGALLTSPLKMGFAYWMRCSEFSADRAAVICDGTSDRMVEVCLRLAGYTKNNKATTNMDAFMEQAEEYRKMVKDSAWDKTMEFLMFNQMSHPLTAVRAAECAEWDKSEQYRQIVELAGNADEDEKMHRNDARTPDSSRKLYGRDYREVVRELTAAGFTNFSTEGREVMKGWMTINDSITRITIDGHSKFEKGDWFPKDAPIVITYQIVIETR